MTPEILIVGGDSGIGRALASRLAEDGVAAVTTTRRRGVPGLPLDLGTDPAGWPALPEAPVAVIAAAVSTMRVCEDDPVGSAKVNVEGTLAIAERLRERGSFVVFLSSNQVFDGSIPCRPAGDRIAPLNGYGRQKAAVEAGLLECGAAAVLRLTKVLAADVPLLNGWAEALIAGRPVTAFSDLTLAPVDRDDVVEILIRLAAARRPGLFQASGDQDVPYVDVALSLAAALAVDAGLIRPGAAVDHGLPPQFCPASTSLDTSAISERLGMALPSSREVIGRIVGQIAARRYRSN